MNNFITVQYADPNVKFMNMYIPITDQINNEHTHINIQIKFENITTKYTVDRKGNTYSHWVF